MVNLQAAIDELIERNGHGAQEIAEALVRGYFPAIYHLALSVIGDAQSADDSAQETLLAAVDKLDQYEPGTNLKAWLYTIALNTCRDHIRKDKRRGRLERVLHRLRFSSNSKTKRPAEDSALHGDLTYELWAGVSELDEVHRMTIILRIANDLSIHEISEIMDVPEKTVYSRLYAAVRELRGTLQRAGYFDP